MVILHVHARTGRRGKVLRDAAEHYKVDIEAISAKVKQEFAAKEKATGAKKAAPKPPTKGVKKTAA